jgi:hypothetical protein
MMNKRKRTRKKHWPAAVFCPIHKRLMPVRCVVGQRQYRYCPVEGCGSTVKTERTKLARPRQPAARLAVGNPANNREQVE